MNYTEEQIIAMRASEEARDFLTNTDWKVIRHRDQLDLGVPTSLTAEEYTFLLQQRQSAREVIIDRVWL